MWFRGSNGCEIECKRLFTLKLEHLELIARANLSPRQRWALLTLLLHDDSRLLALSDGNLGIKLFLQLTAAKPQQDSSPGFDLHQLREIMREHAEQPQ